MAIIKNITTPSGATVNYHEFYSANLIEDNNTAVYVRSFISSEAAKNGLPVTWMWELSVKNVKVSSFTSHGFEEVLVLTEGTPFYGGAIVPSLERLGDTIVDPRPSEYHIFNYATKQWVDPRTTETEWPLVRAKRDELLTQTDWVAARAYERGEPVPQNYVVYRQALRDITNQPDPFNITWPVLENAQ